jgi:hypothetical protein
MPDSPIEESQEPEAGDVQAAAAPAAPASPAPARLMTAGDFVGMDKDQPKADENVQEGADPGAAPAPPSSPGQKGRPRTSNTANAQRMREKYAKQKAARTLPPDFSDLPGGSKPSPAPGQPSPAPQAASMGAMTSEQYRAGAETIVTVVTGMLAMVLSKAWRVDEEEKATLVRDIANMMEYNRWSAFSPNIACMLTVGAFIMSRSNDPETRRKIAGILKKIRGDKGEKSASASDAMSRVETSKRSANPDSDLETLEVD